MEEKDQTENLTMELSTEETEQQPPEQEQQSEKQKKELRRKFWKVILSYALAVLVSGILRAFAIYIFVTPNQFAPGGTNGIAVLLEFATGWNSGYFLLMLSVPLFFVAFFCLGKKEAVLSTLSFFVSSAILLLFNLIENVTGIEHLLPTYGGVAAGAEKIVHGILGAVAGGVFLGLALAIMLKNCGTSGGTTIIASVINKKFRNLSVSMLTSAFDAIVVVVSFFVYNQGASFTDKLDPVILALISLFVTSKVCDVIIYGFKSAYKFEIVTNDPDKLAEEIMTKLHRGVTKISAEGMYKHEGRSMLVVIIRKRQIAALQKIIREFPDTFAYFSSTSEVYGRFLK